MHMLHDRQSDTCIPTAVEAVSSGRGQVGNTRKAPGVFVAMVDTLQGKATARSSCYPPAGGGCTTPTNPEPRAQGFSELHVEAYLTLWLLFLTHIYQAELHRISRCCSTLGSHPSAKTKPTNTHTERERTLTSGKMISNDLPGEHLSLTRNANVIH